MYGRLLSLLIALVATVPAFGQTTTMERAIEDAARNFRIQTYNQFRTNRAEYDLRINAAEEAMSRFKQAADDVGRIEMQQWFFQAGSNQNGSLPEIPEIQLVDKSQRGPRGLGRRTNQPQQAQRQTTNDPNRKNGFVVTQYENNPRFRTHRQNAEFERQASQQRSTSSESDGAITKALKEPGKLFGNIGQSFLRGDNDESTPNVPEGAQDGYPFEEDNSEDTTSMIGETNDNSNGFDEGQFEDTGSGAKSEMQNALDDIIATDSNSSEFDSLNGQIVGQNLAISVLTDDFNSETDQSIEFLTDSVNRLEMLNESAVEIKNQRALLSDAETNDLTAVSSLEEIANQLMGSVNDYAKRLAAGEVNDENGTLETSLTDLRMRLSQILAEQSF